MSPSDVQVLRRAWAAFGRGDIGAAAAALHPDVRWYGAGEPDAAGSCDNREQARAFMQRSVTDGLTADLLDIHDAGDRLVLTVLTHAPPEWGQVAEPHGEVVTVRNGKVTEIVVYPSVEAALAAVGDAELR